jgi:hypothetical protein
MLAAPRVSWCRRVATAAAGALVTLAVAGPASAGPEQVALNGTYRAFSNGEWAKTNEVYIDQKSVISTWTIRSQCSDVATCAGEVTSDAGWSAELEYHSGMWLARRDVANWQQCADGVGSTGHQIFRFAPAGEAGRALVGSSVLGGEDITTGDPGACGVGEPVRIRMPLRLERLT